MSPIAVPKWKDLFCLCQQRAVFESLPESAEPFGAGNRLADYVISVGIQKELGQNEFRAPTQFNK